MMERAFSDIHWLEPHPPPMAKSKTPPRPLREAPPLLNGESGWGREGAGKF
jgi:hypothetical protein